MTRTQFNVRIQEATRTALRVEAAQQGISQSKLANNLLTEGLERLRQQRLAWNRLQDRLQAALDAAQLAEREDKA